MINIKNIVKVMNFHSLVRVDKAKRVSEKYFEVEKELTNFINQIINNRNLNLDKKNYKPNESGIILNIYIGNDLGFCGNFNTQLSNAIKSDTNTKKIIIGKKIIQKTDDVILNISKEEFYSDFNKIEVLINSYIKNQEIKEINVIYNRYNNVNDISFQKVKLFPVEFDNDDKLKVDYVIETDVNQLIVNLLSLYLCYQIKIIECNSWASENVMRQMITKQSIKKLDEIEIENKKIERKNKKYIAFKKQLSNYKNKR